MSLTVKPQVRARAKISSVGAYVPPRLLTNADLEKMVETNDQWIVERTGIHQRHIAEKGVATSDLAVEAAKRCLAGPRDRGQRGGGDHCRDRDAGYVLPGDGLPGAGQAGSEGRLGVRPLGGVFGLSLCAAGGGEAGGERRPQKGHGDRRGRDEFDSGLYGPVDLHPVRRRRGRGAAGADGRGRDRHGGFRSRDRWIGCLVALYAGRRQPASFDRGDGCQQDALCSSGREARSSRWRCARWRS